MFKVVAGQIGLGTLLAAAFWGYSGTVAGYSALAGCLVSALPNAFLALRLALTRADAGPRGLLRAAWAGEFGKLALTVLLFSIVFVLVRPLAAMPLFTTFIVTALVPAFGLLARDGQEERQETVTSNGK